MIMEISENNLSQIRETRGAELAPGKSADEQRDRPETG